MNYLNSLMDLFFALPGSAHTPLDDFHPSETHELDQDPLKAEPMSPAQTHPLIKLRGAYACLREQMISLCDMIATAIDKYAQLCVHKEFGVDWQEEDLQVTFTTCKSTKTN